MNERNDTSFVIKDTIIVDRNIQLDSVLQNIKAHPQILSAEQQIMVNEYSEREINAQRLPSVRLNGGYNYNRNQSAAGFTLLNQSSGPFLGVNLQVPIFNGGVFKRQGRVAEINTNNARLLRDDLVSNFESSAFRAWQTYRNTLPRLETQRENNKLAADLFNLVLQRFQLGVGTIVDVREAQRSFQDAGFRLVNLAYDAKVAEIELKRLASRLDF